MSKQLHGVVLFVCRHDRQVTALFIPFHFLFRQSDSTGEGLSLGGVDVIRELLEMVVDDFDVVFVRLPSLSEPVNKANAQIDSRRLSLDSTKHILDKN